MPGPAYVIYGSGHQCWGGSLEQLQVLKPFTCEECEEECEEPQAVAVKVPEPVPDAATARIAELAAEAAQIKSDAWCLRCNGRLLGGPWFMGRTCGTCHSPTILVDDHIAQLKRQLTEANAARADEAVAIRTLKRFFLGRGKLPRLIDEQTDLMWFVGRAEALITKHDAAAQHLRDYRDQAGKPIRLAADVVLTLIEDELEQLK